MFKKALSLVVSLMLMVTSLSFAAKELGIRACKNLLHQIEGEETIERTLLPYEVVLKESTQ